MTAITVDGTDLDVMGFALRTLDARNMASWVADRVLIPGRNTAADVNGRYGEPTVAIGGILSAPVTPWANHTHANYLARLNQLKSFLDPERGYRQLKVVDDTTVYRWVRAREHAVEERPPILKLPFQPIAVTFDALEPFWRKTATPVTSAAASFTVPNNGKKTRPVITATMTGAVSGGSVVALFKVGSLTISWDTSLIPLASTDKIRINADTMVVEYQALGTGSWMDAVRAYRYDVFTDGGFPVLDAAAGYPAGATNTTIGTKHASVGSITVEYDEMFL